jgi:GNAT superfamily N-acetyltransferase
VTFQVENRPDPLDIEYLELQIRREASAAMGLGEEVDLAIFVREAGTVVAGISGWTWGDCCELQNLWVEPSRRGSGLASRLIAAAEAEAAARGCSQTIHFTYDFQARALYEKNGYELVGCVDNFPSGTNVLWYRKSLGPAVVSAKPGMAPQKRKDSCHSAGPTRKGRPDTVDGVPISEDCPTCGSGDVPYLVVRSSSKQNGDGVSWRCRRCRSEWSNSPSDEPLRNSGQQSSKECSSADRRDA